MTTPYDVYVAYVTARQIRKPKSSKPLTEEKYRNRLSSKNLEIIDLLSGFFNTIYSNINPTMYMLCGFKIFKTFKYSNFLNEKILDEFIREDKRQKRNLDVTEDDIHKSFNHINMPLKDYCKLMDGIQKMIITDYLLNNIHGSIIVYCMFKKLISFSSLEKNYIYYIDNNFNDYLKSMFKREQLIKELDYKFTSNQE